MPLNLLDASELPAAVCAELLRGHHAKAALAEAQQRQVEQEHAEIRARLIDGLGQLTMRVDSDVYWNMVRRFGEGCWAAKGFRKDFQRHNPGARVKAARHTGRIIRP